MQQQYDNTNSGALKVAQQKKSEKSPDYNGRINVEGREYYISGWAKVSKQGEDYLSLSVRPIDQQGQQYGNQQGNQMYGQQQPPMRPQQPQRAAGFARSPQGGFPQQRNDMDQDIPF